MGIDIYMHWAGQTPEDANKQITGFSVTAGEAGYLREAYHGGPYVTRWLVQESFDESWYDAATEEERDNFKGHAIPAATLRARLPAAIFLALARHAVIYGGDPFEGIGGVVELPPDTPDDPEAAMRSPAMMSELHKVFEDIGKMREGRLELSLATKLTDEQIVAIVQLIRSRNLPDYALSFVDFVRLAEVKEAETGEPVKVYASY